MPDYLKHPCGYCGRLIDTIEVYPPFCSTTCHSAAKARRESGDPIPAEYIDCRVTRLNGITTEEAAQVLGITVEQVRKKIREGKLLAEKILGRWFISRRSVIECAITILDRMGRGKGRPTRAEAMARFGYKSIFDENGNEIVEEDE